MSENDELLALLEQNTGPSYGRVTTDAVCNSKPAEPPPVNLGYKQWSSSDDVSYFPTSSTYPKLTPGVYDIIACPQRGIGFSRIPVLTRHLIRFPETNIDRVVNEIEKFWDRESIFKEYNITYRRGVMLWGPQGCGKTSLISLVMEDVVKRNGIVVRFGHPNMFIEGMKILRAIEPKTPIVVLMEDIDATLAMYNESEVLNILDGVNQLDRIVYLATTNYPERLGARIINRPSRFDRRFKIDYPNTESRSLYFTSLIGTKHNAEELGIDLKQWVNDTEKFSFAHLKELFTGVVVFGDPYEECLDTLCMMREKHPSSDDDIEKSRVGFITPAKRPYSIENGYGTYK